MNAANRKRFLLTTQGTLVHYDPSVNRLRHGKLGECPRNIHATDDAGVVLLLLDDETGTRRLGNISRGFCDVLNDGGALKFVTLPAADGWVALRNDGWHLAADDRGEMSCWHLTPGGREQFLLLGEDDLAALTFILANRWFAPGRGAIETPSMVAREGRCWVDFGRIQVSVGEILRAAKAAASETGPVPREMLVRYDTWKIEHYCLYRPLAYFVIYGKPELFDCGEIAIATLFQFGAWDGDVMIITDQASFGFIDRIPAEFRHRVHFVTISAHDLLDYTLARYKIIDVPAALPYQPVLYLDVDIVCDAPLSALVTSLLTSSDLHACHEFRLDNPGDYYAISMLRKDGIQPSPDQLGFSSGVFAFRDIRQQRALFEAIIETAYIYTIEMQRRATFALYDQPFFNYVLHKAGLGNGALIAKFLEIRQASLPPLAEPLRKGLIHFCGGVGEMTPKLAQMIGYAEALKRR